MATTPFVSVEWATDEVVTKDKMDQQNFNAQYLMEHTPRIRMIRDDRKNLDVDLLVIAGRVKIPKNNKDNISSARVDLPKGFSPATRINVTTGIVSQPYRRIHCVISGFGDDKLPDHRGFLVKVYVADATMVKPDGSKKKIPTIDKEFWVSYIATGVSKDTQ